MKLGNPNARVDRKLEVVQIQPHPPLEVKLNCTEFTCRCPVTNQPDWANLVIEYVPDEVIVESKSVKLYLETWRDEGIFHEHLAQRVLQDFVDVLNPIWCSVTVNFNSRGGIAITATAQYYRGENEDVEVMSMPLTE